jgi:Holliday junction resolvase RusA-like endonuclease
MEITIVLPGQPATKKNHSIICSLPNGRSILVPSKPYREFEKSCLNYLKAYTGPRFTGPIEMITLYYLKKGRAQPDLTNLMAATHDILEKAGVIDNDRNIVSVDGSRIMGISLKEPRTEVIIKQLQKTLFE